jgi:hypothetical protein
MELIKKIEKIQRPYIQIGAITLKMTSYRTITKKAFEKR